MCSVLKSLVSQSHFIVMLILLVFMESDSFRVLTISSLIKVFVNLNVWKSTELVSHLTDEPHH